MAEAMPKPGIWTRTVYGLGSVAFGTKDAGFNTFLLIYYNQVDRGDHFAAWQEPDLFATEVRAGFRSLR